jgi:hypothetical protein
VECWTECRSAHCLLPRNGWRHFLKIILTSRCPWLDHLIASSIWWWRVSLKLSVAWYIVGV